MKRKPVVQESSSSSEETDSGDEDENQQEFVRRERAQQKSVDKVARSPPSNLEIEGDGERNDQSDEDDLDAFDGTQKARREENSSSTDSADSDSETTSASDGKSPKPSRQAPVLHEVEDAKARRGNKEAAGEVLPNCNTIPSDTSPKKPKDKSSKRKREEQSVQEKSPLKKRKEEKLDLTAKAFEHVRKGKDSAKASPAMNTILEKKGESKKSANGPAPVERSEDLVARQNSATKTEGPSSKKAVDKGKNAKKAAKNEDREIAKGSSSPGKHKLFTGKDEIVLTSEVLHDIQTGVDVPSKKTDDYWSKLAERVDGRMEGPWSKEQLCVKLKRMRQRYLGMAEKLKSSGDLKFRNTIDEELYTMWDKMWGSRDPVKVDREDVKNKMSQAVATTSPMKAGKASCNEVTCLVRNVRVTKGKTEALKKTGDSSRSEESDDGSESPNEDLATSPVEIDLKDVHGDDKHKFHSISELPQGLQKEVQATLAEVQKSSMGILKDWQSKALTAVEMFLKSLADQARSVNAFDIGSFDEPFILSKKLDQSDSRLYEGDHTLQQQWRELRLKELEVHRQRLELMQRECQLKEERLKALLMKK